MERQGIQSSELIAAEIALNVTDGAYEQKLAELNERLDRVTNHADKNHADKIDYALSVTSGIICGLFYTTYMKLLPDGMLPDISLSEFKDWGVDKIRDTFFDVMRKGRVDDDKIKECIHLFGKMLSLAREKANDGGCCVSNYCDSEFSEISSSPYAWLGCSLWAQFTGCVFEQNGNGTLTIVPIPPENVEGNYLLGKTVLTKILFGVIQWLFLLVIKLDTEELNLEDNDEIKEPLLGLLRKMSTLLNGAKLKFALLKYALNRFHNEFDIHQNIEMLKTMSERCSALGKQAMPVLLNEYIVRGVYSLRRLLLELEKTPVRSEDDFDMLNWNAILPNQNRTLNRMLEISQLTFGAVDVWSEKDAVISMVKSIESVGSKIIEAKRFTSRFRLVNAENKINIIGNCLCAAEIVKCATHLNLVNAASLGILVMNEISGAVQEQRLACERRFLIESHCDEKIQKLREYCDLLERYLEQYMAENLQAFLMGTDVMDEAEAMGNSDLFIQGNVVIQRVLGRELQFRNQDEFDSLMESDEDFVL